MINAKDNHKNSEINTNCEFSESDDTTEHMLEYCPILPLLPHTTDTDPRRDESDKFRISRYHARAKTNS